MKRLALLVLLLLTGCASLQETPSSNDTSSSNATEPSEPVSTSSAPMPRVARAEPERGSISANGAATPPPSEEKSAPTESRPAYCTDLAHLATYNDDRLIDVYVGMTKNEVEQQMTLSSLCPWKNPYRHQPIHVGDKLYEVWFFLTREPSRRQRITEKNLTPVILADNKVVAIGHYPLKKLRHGDSIGH